MLLATRDYLEEDVNSNHQEILSALKAITNVSIPRKSDNQSKNVKKKQRKFQKNRKHQSKSWDIETQEQIRAEQAARRVKNERDDSRLEDSVTMKGTSDSQHNYESYRPVLWINWIYELKEFGRPNEGLEEEHPTSDVGDDSGPERVGCRSGVAHRGIRWNSAEKTCNWAARC